MKRWLVVGLVAAAAAPVVAWFQASSQEEWLRQGSVS